MPEFFQIYDNPNTQSVEVLNGSHEDAAYEIKIIPVDDQGLIDILDGGKDGLDDDGLAKLRALNLKAITPPTDDQVRKLRNISESVGIERDYMPSETIDVAHKGLPEITLDDIDVVGQQWFPSGIFGTRGEAERQRQQEHVVEIRKHIEADKSAMWVKEGL